MINKVKKIGRFQTLQIDVCNICKVGIVVNSTIVIVNGNFNLIFGQTRKVFEEKTLKKANSAVKK